MSTPFHHISGNPSVPLFLFGDHASKHLPARYDNLGLSGDDLTRHIAWDIGTEAIIRGICKRFGNSAIVAGFSRLLIDPNRGLHMDSVIPEFSDGTDIPGNQNLDAKAREERVETLYRPYHKALSSALDALDSPLTISVHSFTPKPHEGEMRTVDLGLLVKQDVETAEIFQGHVCEVAPELSVGVNKPYSAYDLNHTIDAHVVPRGWPHLAIEIRQDHINTEQGVARWIDILGDALEPMMG